MVSKVRGLRPPNIKGRDASGQDGRGEGLEGQGARKRGGRLKTWNARISERQGGRWRPLQLAADKGCVDCAVDDGGKYFCSLPLLLS